MYYVEHQEEDHDPKAKSPNSGCNCFDTWDFGGHDSVMIKPKQIIASKQLAQLILTQDSTLLFHYFPLLSSSPPLYHPDAAAFPVWAMLSSREPSCQLRSLGDVAVQRAPFTRSGTAQKLSATCQPHSNWYQRGTSTTSQAARGLWFVFFFFFALALQCAELLSQAH